MRILLSDGNGLTSRQLCTILARKHHTVHILSPGGLSLTKLTRHTTKVHAVPPFGQDPYRWLAAALAVMQACAIECLICSQEQVAVLSLEVDKVRSLGVKIAVPRFGALARVMGKVAAARTLAEAGLAQPEAFVLSDVVGLEERLARWFPCYLKRPIGTASKGLRYAASWEDVDLAWLEACFESSGQVLVQRAEEGPLAMIQSVFHQGALLAWHACLRVRDGPSGGAAKKTSIVLPGLEDDLAALGTLLGWDGALSLDAVLVGGRKPVYIDVNPRIVEPVNALHSGVDLVQALLDISTVDPGLCLCPQPEVLAVGKAGVSTHQTILALIKALERGRGGMVWEALDAFLGRGEYRDSVEELTPLAGDPLSAIAVVAVFAVLLIGGMAAARKLDGETVTNYALSPSAWNELVSKHEGSIRT
jgi:hypothetical protein